MTGRAVAMSREWESGSRDRKSSRLFSKGCCFSVAKSCPTFCDPMDCRMPGFLVLHCLPEFAQTHIHWVGNAIQPFPPPALNLSQHQGLFQWVSASHQVPIVSGSASVLPVNIQGWFPLGWIYLISFRIDWFNLLAVQGTLKNLLQHHFSKASVLQCSAFLMGKLSHPYMTPGKTIALTVWTFVGKVMSVFEYAV